MGGPCVVPRDAGLLADLPSSKAVSQCRVACSPRKNVTRAWPRQTPIKPRRACVAATRSSETRAIPPARKGGKICGLVVEESQSIPPDRSPKPSPRLTRRRSTRTALRLARGSLTLRMQPLPHRRNAAVAPVLCRRKIREAPAYALLWTSVVAPFQLSRPRSCLAV